MKWVFLFLFVSSLWAQEYYKIILKSYPKEPKSNQDVLQFQKYFPDFPVPKIRASGRYYILVIEPIEGKSRAKRLLDQVRKRYRGAFVNRYTLEVQKPQLPVQREHVPLATSSSQHQEAKQKQKEQQREKETEQQGGAQQLQDVRRIESNAVSKTKSGDVRPLQDVRVDKNISSSSVTHQVSKSKATLPTSEEVVEDEALLLPMMVEDEPALQQEKREVRASERTFHPLLLVVALFLLVIVVVIALWGYSQFKVAKGLQKELAGLKERLSANDKDQSEYIAKIVHELRSPLNAIIGLIELIKESGYQKEDVEENINYIENSARYLLNLVNDLLDLGQIKAGKFHVAQRVFDLNDALMKVRSVALMYAKGNGVSLDFYIGPYVPPYLIGDATRLNQILINIVVNAIKFTPRGKKVMVRIYREKLVQNRVFLVFEVEDEGIGMSQEQLKNLFGMFQKGGGNVEGHGIGLSVVNQLVKAMGGKIEVESQLSVGTKFKVVLPFEVYKKFGKMSYRLPHSEVKSWRVVICEDGTFNADFLEEFLHFLGLNVVRRTRPPHTIDAKELVLISADAFAKSGCPKGRYVIVKEFGQKIKECEKEAEAILYKPFTQKEIYEQIMRVILRNA